MNNFAALLIKSLVISFITFAAPLSHFENVPLVYFITGGPVDIQALQVTNAEKAIKNYIKQRSPVSQFYSIHNSRWPSICAGIVDAQTKSHRGYKVILIGHSYGANAGITVARCLAENGLGVDRLITLDTVQKPFDFPADVVSENVKFNNNFYETSDFFLSGIKSEHREDQTIRNITNTEVKVSRMSFSPHFDMLTEAFDKGYVQDVLAQDLN